MNRLHGWTFPSVRRLCHSKNVSETLREISAVRNYTTSSASESQGQTGKLCCRELRTLRVDKLSSVGQPILNLSHLRQPSLRISNGALPKSFNRRDSVVTGLYYGTRAAARQMYPTGTQGVFYLHYVQGDKIQSQIRFRLCNMLDEFHHGRDLRGLDGSPWKLTLRAVARAPAKYHALLALLQKEFPIEPRNIDSSHNCHRVVSTLNPQKLPSSGQSVMDFSGLAVAKIHLGERGAASRTDLAYKAVPGDGKGTSSKLTYPPDAIGVFYYKQSLTAPSQLGELRFRLCHNVQDFAQGSDLCLPSGDPWFLSSLVIRMGKSYQALHNSLTKEGLLAASLPPGTSNPSQSLVIMPLRVLSDPFVVDLSATSFQFDINNINDPYITASRVAPRYTFYNPHHKGKALFRGRVVVRLEERPGLLPGDNPAGPVVMMRFLEMLTPVQRLSDDDFVQFPQEGELLHRRDEFGQYVPWAYSPRALRKVWTDWIAWSRAQV